MLLLLPTLYSRAFPSLALSLSLSLASVTEREKRTGFSHSIPTRRLGNELLHQTHTRTDSHLHSLSLSLGCCRRKRRALEFPETGARGAGDATGGQEPSSPAAEADGYPASDAQIIEQRKFIERRRERSHTDTYMNSNAQTCLHQQASAGIRSFESLSLSPCLAWQMISFDCISIFFPICPGLLPSITTEIPIFPSLPLPSLSLSLYLSLACLRLSIPADMSGQSLLHANGESIFTSSCSLHLFCHLFSLLLLAFPRPLFPGLMLGIHCRRLTSPPSFPSSSSAPEGIPSPSLMANMFSPGTSSSTCEI